MALTVITEEGVPVQPELALVEFRGGPEVDDDTFCAQQAEAIRVLAKRTTSDIIEIGGRLKAVHTIKSRQGSDGPGAWYRWLDKEFGWSDWTAGKFIAVYQTLRDESEIISDSAGIDASALFRLASPTTPPSVRKEAIREALEGTHITKAKADELIAAATKAAAERAIAEAREALEAEKRQAIDDAIQDLTEGNDALRERLAEITDEVEADRLAAIAEATKELADDNAALNARVAEIEHASEEEKARAVAEAMQELAEDRDELQKRLAEIEESMREPKIADICKAIEKSLNIPKMKPEQYKLLARLMNTYITVGKRTYDPLSEEQGAISNENLKTSSDITSALRSLKSAPAPEDFVKMTLPVQRNQHRDMIDDVISWLQDYSDTLGEDKENV
jgi:hypothetical protein